MLGMPPQRSVTRGAGHHIYACVGVSGTPSGRSVTVLFSLSVRKAISGSSGLNYKWSNRYFVEAADAVSAAALGNGFWTRERLFHNADAFAYQFYATDLVPNTTNFAYATPAAATQFGAWVQGGDWYADFVCVRVDMTVPNSRASRKFFHIPLRESDVTDGKVISAGLLAAISTGMGQIVAVAQLRDESGNAITGFVNHGITSRRLGRQAYHDIPQPQGI